MSFSTQTYTQEKSCELNEVSGVVILFLIACCKCWYMVVTRYGVWTDNWIY
jgi:hypothetical protein